MTNWEAVGEKAAALLSQYIQIPSLNPPGDERAAADYLAKQLAAIGLPARRFRPQPERVNLVARLKGDGTARPILLYNHMDVVPAPPERWTVDPFGGAIRDGYVWGRGAIDMKGMAIMQLLALELLRELPHRRRDIIFFAAADEEKGGEFGTQWMIAHHWPEIDAEFVWDEGSFGLQEFFGPQPVFTIAVAEKKDLWLRVEARGEPGHSGMPHDDNAAQILLRALDKITAINRQYTLNPITAQMFTAISRTMPFPRSFLLRNLHNPLIFRLAQPQLTADNSIAAMLQDTISVTVLRAGEKENVIPDKAEATLDVRLLPERDPQAFITKLKRVVNDERVQFEIIQYPEETTISSVDSDFYRALGTVLGECVEGTAVAPMLTPGTTDSCFFRRKGVHSYGLFPAILTPGELARFHGIDERISIANLQLGTKIMFETLKRLLS